MGLLLCRVWSINGGFESKIIRASLHFGNCGNLPSYHVSCIACFSNAS
jgi:hypothetical protein